MYESISTNLIRYDFLESLHVRISHLLLITSEVDKRDWYFKTFTHVLFHEQKWTFYKKKKTLFKNNSVKNLHNNAINKYLP